MKLTNQQKKDLAFELRAIADKLDKGMVIEEIKYDWQILDNGKEEVYVGSLDPRFEEGFRSVQVRPAVMRYQLNMIAQPQMYEQDEEKPKKKKKKGGKKK